MSNLTVSSAVDTLMAASDIAGLRAALALTTIPLVNSTNAAASAPPVSITGSWFSGGSATTTKPQLLIEASGATSTGWATAGTGLGVNAASGFAGNLIDAQVNGSSKFSVNSSGRVTGSDLAIFANGFSTRTSTGKIYLGASEDVQLNWDAANTLALRNGANAQSLNIYESYTSGSVLSRMFARYSVANSRYEIGTEHVGASARKLALMIGSTAALEFATSGNATFSGSVTVAATGLFSNSGRVVVSSPAAGIWTLQNNTQTDWDRLQFGGTTSSFPSLKRSSAILQARLADDSDFCNIQGILQTAANAVAETPTATHTLLLRDAAGTTYKVLAVAA